MFVSLSRPGGHASGDLASGAATSPRKEGEREGNCGIVFAKKQSHEQVIPFTKRGREEELLLFSVWWGIKEKKKKKQRHETTVRR